MRRSLYRIRPMPVTQATLFRCVAGHFFFHPHSTCPRCGKPLLPVTVRGTGTLISHTRLEITPTGEALTLGIVQHRRGAKTLCRIVGDIRGNGRDRVSILEIEGRFHAVGRSTRVSRRRDPQRTLIEIRQETL